MRSIVKFIIYTLFLILVPSLVMVLVTSLGGDSFIVIFLGQLVVILLLLGFFLLSRKIINKYEKETLAIIENEDDIGRLKDLRNKRISYMSKANITKRIIDIDYSKKECQNLRKYSSFYEDNIFYYAALIKNERDDREIFKEKRDNFKKRFKNKKFAFLDLRENVKTSLKWMGVFFLTSFISFVNPYKFVTNLDLYTLLVMINFGLNLALVVNTIIWIIRSLKAYWLKDYM